MQVGGVGGTLSYRPPAITSRRAGSADFVARSRGREAGRLLGRLQESLAALGRADPGRGIRVVARRAPGTRSDARLGLRMDPLAASIQSSQEVNGLTTSYSPTNPSWQGASTAPVTVSGLYNGSQGTDTLEVVVTRVRGNGSRDLSLRDGTGSEIERVLIGRNEPDGAPQNLSNGLVLSFATRDMVVGDRFTIDVVSSAPEFANPDGAFNASGPAGPNFDPAVSVGAGSFTVNGITINVAADDTINAVLGQITALTDVIASFSTATDTVELTQKTPGAGPSISLGVDSSGFLAAVKLDTAVLSAGDDGEHNMPIDDVASLERIRSGRFWVNETRVRRIQPGMDSLADVLALINDVDGVSAGYVLSRDRVVINGSGDLLHLDDPRTRFFDTVGIVARDYSSRSAERGLGTSARREVANGMSAMVRDINKLLGLSQSAGAGLVGFESSVDALLAEMDEDGALSAVGLGRRLRGQTGLRFGEIEVRRMERALREDPDGALALLFGDRDGEAGLISRLATITEAAISISELGLSG